MWPSSGLIRQGTIELDHHLWIIVLFLPDPGDGTKYVPDRGKAEKADGKVLWHQVYCPPGIPGSPVLYFRGNHVPGASDSGKTGLDGGSL